MITIDRKYEPTYNNLVQQLKQIKDRVTAEEWNILWNTLAQQADATAEQLSILHNFIFGTSEESEILELPEGMHSIFDVVKQLEYAWVSKESEGAPDNPNITVWYAIQDKD